MCVSSMVMDHYRDKWQDHWPITPSVPSAPWPGNPLPGAPFQPGIVISTTSPPVTQEQFDELKKEVLEMKALLIRALEYDKKNNEPHCEMEEKVAVIKAVAELVGVNIEDVLSDK